MILRPMCNYHYHSSIRDYSCASFIIIVIIHFFLRSSPFILLIIIIYVLCTNSLCLFAKWRFNIHTFSLHLWHWEKCISNNKCRQIQWFDVNKLVALWLCIEKHTHTHIKLFINDYETENSSYQYFEQQQTYKLNVCISEINRKQDKEAMKKKETLD